MIQVHLKTTFCFVVFAILVPKHCVNAKCCNQSYSVRHYCTDTPGERFIKVTQNGRKCITKICMNGQPMMHYCSHGYCNATGCNCTEICLNNSRGTWMEAERLFTSNYGVRLYPKRIQPQIVNKSVIVYE